MNSSSLEASSINCKNKYKIVFLGDMSVGKSSIIERFMKGCFNEKHNPTVGIDFLSKNIYCKSSNYRLQLWDTGGQERYKSLIPAYLKNTNCAVFIFDVTSRDSFTNLKNWIKIFEDNRPEDAATIILGNKIDLPRRVSQAEAKEQARISDMPYFEVSAKTAENLEKFFECAIEVINEVKSSASTQATSRNQNPPSSKSLTDGVHSEEQLRRRARKVEVKLPSYRKKECCYI